MKKLYTIATALLLVAGTFTSCTKDLDEVGLSASSSNAAKDVTVPNSNKPVDAGLTLGFSNTSPVVGTTTTVTAAFVTLPTKGTLNIEQATDASATNWVKVKVYDLSKYTGPFTYDFTTNVAGTYSFRAHYTPGGSNFSQAQVINAVTFVEARCEQGMTAQVVASENLGGNNYRLKVAFTLTTCEAYANVHLQGGLTAKTFNVSTDGTVRKQTNNDNYIIMWDEASLAKGTKTYYVTFEKEIKGAGAVTGDWSAKTPDGTVVAATQGAYFDPVK